MGTPYFIQVASCTSQKGLHPMDLLTSCLPGQLRPLTCEFLFMG